MSQVEQPIFAVQHAFGMSLVQAPSRTQALQVALHEFGNSGYPYVVPKEQAQAIEWAKSMGASVLSKGV